MPTAYDFIATTIEGDSRSLSDYAGWVILVVNVASKCGFTTQYEGLERLHRQHSDDVVVLGFPCDQFGNQEPGSEEEIQRFCSLTYGVTFPVFAKIEVNGGGAHPLYSPGFGLRNPDLTGLISSGTSRSSSSAGTGALSSVTSRKSSQKRFCPTSRQPPRPDGQRGELTLARLAVRSMLSANTGQSSRGRSCPSPGISSSSAPGIARAVARPPETWTSRSAFP